MILNSDTDFVDLVVLAGGAATRLGALSQGMPKPLLPVRGLPFLAYPISRLAKTVRLGRIIPIVKKGAADQFRNSLSTLPYPLRIIEENYPVGTGGAILSARDSAGLSDPFLVMNGDVLFRMDGQALVAAARTHGAAIAAIHVPDAGRFGALDVKNGMVSAFREKEAGAGAGLINAGLYAFTAESLKGFETRPCSFERDIAPVLAAGGRLAAVEAAGPFLDIGTPETLVSAEAFVRAAASF